MKKLDKLLLKTFVGPLILTFLVSVFILLTQYMLKYFDEFVGKDLGFEVFAELITYFSINMTPIALPLAVLISSLMTYGKLGEHFELTAIKGSGISLLRTLRPTFILIVIVSIAAFFSNDNLVPMANLRAYSLLYDIKHKKPALDLKEGQFYDGIPNYSIKVKRKFPDGIAMKDVIIYDHKNSSGNKKVILADSCRMYTIINDRYLLMELYNGNHYLEQKKKKPGTKRSHVEDFARTKFNKMKMVFSLASFDLDRTDMDLFAGNRMMKNLSELEDSIDSMNNQVVEGKFRLFNTLSTTYRLHQEGDIAPPESLALAKKALDKIRNEKDSLKSLYQNADSTQSQTVANNADTTKKTTKGQKPGASQSGYNPNKNVAMTTSSPQGQGQSEEVGSIASKIAKAKQYKANQRSTAAPKLPQKMIPVGKTFLSQMDTLKEKGPKVDTLLMADVGGFEKVKLKIDSQANVAVNKKHILSRAVGSARNIKSNLHTNKSKLGALRKQIDTHTLEKFKKFAQAASCIVMFLIGAPLGAIIKRGGLGIPVIISVFFFIIFYVLTLVSEKWAKEGLMDGMYAAWVANMVLLPIGLFFLRQARLDTKLFDADFYNVWIDNLKKWWSRRKPALKPA